MLDEDCWRVIRKLPRGTRSRAVNIAIRQWSGMARRREAAALMDEYRARLPAVRTRPNRKVDPRGPGGQGAELIVTPDASVILRWILPGGSPQDSLAALMLRDHAVAGTVELIVPQLWVYEVGGMLTTLFPEDAGRLLAPLADFGLTEARPDSRWRDRAASLAATYQVPFHDAAYHAVALDRGGVFVTADQGYVRRAAAAGGVCSLRNWRFPAR